MRTESRAGGMRTLVLVFLAAAHAVPARAGGGPENVFLLVNSRSESSKTIANHYIQWRRIPPSNVLYLDWNGSLERVSVTRFRTSILEPAIAAIRRRGLADQIDYVIYSSDFPWSVNLEPDRASLPRNDRLRPVGSLTAATYLWRLVAAKSPRTVSLSNNWYAQPPATAGYVLVSQAFRSRDLWGPGGRRLDAGGLSYLLSTMLAVTSGRGNTVAEALAYLRRSVQADGKHPRGTIYFVKNKTPRSTPRHNLFPAAVAALGRLGVRAEILEGTIPRNRHDVQGVMLGTARFQWGSSGNTIRAGAICEHLTSAGGNFRLKATQTPLTEFLKYGAAGASGTVIEPYNFPQKFPSPSVQVHYARGCSLAEAFYQSVAGPYQLLIVGDPLCQPWAVVPKIEARGISPGQTVRGTVEIEPRAGTDNRCQIGQFELFVDGRRHAACGTGERLRFFSKTTVDGQHELRVVAIGSDPIKSQGRVLIPVKVDNRSGQIELKVEPPGPVSWDQTLTVQARSSGATAITVLQNGRALATLPGPQGSARIAARQLGRGPVVLYALSEGPRPARSPPVALRVK
ncbi:MAG: hypothetical protein BMS9Abin04_389 [Planctomycetia bacterium]|nr:MAG: hypothetical protein BMS9Abin04_389 [Planctomycetia bacterium]